MKTIAEKLQIIKNSTDAIRAAIVAKGIQVSGNIETWANDIANIGTIAITINGVEYRSESGMTWTNWVVSKYNTGGFIILDTYVATSDSSKVISGVSPSDIITQTLYTLIEKPNIITFTIYDGASSGKFSTTKCTCPPGMTWQQFMNSEYNTNLSFYTRYNWVELYGSGSEANKGIVYNSKDASYSNHTLYSDTIINGNSYYIMSWLCCFVPGTQVLTSLDGNTKNIEDIQKDDVVISYNMETKQNYEAICDFTTVNKNSVYMAKVICQDGTELEMTDYHPLYTKDGWKSLTNYNNYPTLRVGDMVKTVDDWSEVLEIKMYKLDSPINTYTLGIRDKDEKFDVDLHDGFYANGVLAHNAPSSC